MSQVQWNWKHCATLTDSNRCYIGAGQRAGGNFEDLPQVLWQRHVPEVQRHGKNQLSITGMNQSPEFTRMSEAGKGL